MRILGIDTATWRASVGLCDEGRIISEHSEMTQGNHAATLLPTIERLLQDTGWVLADLDALAVSAGPGSFTGLRVGLSVGKGLSRGLGIPLVTVPTLEALARTVSDNHRTVCTLLDARRGELYAACFDTNGNGLERVLEECLLTPQALLEVLPHPCTIVGDAIVEYAEFLRQHVGDDVTILPFETHGPDGSIVALLAGERLRRAPADDLASLEPHYIRPSEAERKMT